jgi:hypothetical protein
VLNKILPDYLRDPEVAAVAERLAADAPALGAGPAAEAGPPDAVIRVLREVAESFRNFAVVAKREAEQRAELATVPDVVATVPFFDDDVCDLGGLLRLGRTIWE